MSKIEKALNRARQGQGDLQVVPLAASVAPTPGTAVAAAQAMHPETIPRMAMSETRVLNARELAQRRVIQPQFSEDTVVQVFRELRTKIIEHSRGRNAVILVSGVTKGCGASFTSRNLAAAFAFDVGKTALLIDCNLSNPSAHQLLAHAEALGLTEYFAAPDLDIKDIIHPVGIARYRVIPAGKRRDVLEEHFASDKMKRLIETVRLRYQERFIIIDGPPMVKSADIRILSQLSDYVLIVARYARTTNAQIAKCLDATDEKKVLGIVFNEEPRLPPLR